MRASKILDNNECLYHVCTTWSVWSPAKLCKSLLIRSCNTVGFIADIVGVQARAGRKSCFNYDVVLSSQFSRLSYSNFHFPSRGATEVALPADDIIINWLHCTHWYSNYTGSSDHFSFHLQFLTLIGVSFSRIGSSYMSVWQVQVKNPFNLWRGDLKNDNNKADWYVRKILHMMNYQIIVE